MLSSFGHLLCLFSAASGEVQVNSKPYPQVGTIIFILLSMWIIPPLLCFCYCFSGLVWNALRDQASNLSFPRVKEKFLLAFRLNFRLLFLCLPGSITLNNNFSSSVVCLSFRWLLVAITVLNQVLFNQLLIFCIPPFPHNWTSWSSWSQLNIRIVGFSCDCLSSIILEAFLALTVLDNMAFGILLLSKNMNRDCPRRLIALFSPFLWEWWNGWSCSKQAKLKRKLSVLFERKLSLVNRNYIKPD